MTKAEAHFYLKATLIHITLDIVFEIHILIVM